MPRRLVDNNQRLWPIAPAEVTLSRYRILLILRFLILSIPTAWDVGANDLVSRDFGATRLAVVKFLGSLLQLSFDARVCGGTSTINAVSVGF